MAALQKTARCLNAALLILLLLVVAVSPVAQAVTTTVPAQPTGLTTKVNATGGIILSWTAPRDTTITDWEYRISAVISNPSWGNSVKVLGADSGTRTVEVYTRAEFWHGQKLEFQVRSGNISGKSPWSEKASATVSNPYLPSFEVEPVEIRVAQGGTATYTLKNVGRGVPGTVELSSRDNSIAMVPSTVTFEDTRETSKQITVTGVAVGSTEISHDAFYIKFRGPTSSIASFEDMVTVKVRVVPQKPDKPTGLTAVAGNAQATLSWTDPGNSSITGWQYQKKINTSSYGSWVSMSDSVASTTSYTVKNLHLFAIAKYAFRIRAVNDGGGSPPSDEVEVQLRYQAPAKPTGLKATADDEQITLSWTNPINPNILRWEYRQKSGTGNYSGWTAISGSNASTSNHTVRSLNNGTSYAFQIRAVNHARQPSGPSDEVRGTPVVPHTVSVPATLTVTEGAGDATVTVTTAAAFGRSLTFSVTYGGMATGAANPSDGDYDNDAVTMLTFGAGDITKDIVIPITDDDIDEKNETFTVTIAPAEDLPQGFKLVTEKTTVTITDDDESPILADIADVTIKLGETVDITASATDGDNDTITYVWTRLDGETIPVLPSGTDLTKARLTFTPSVGGLSPFVGSSASYTMIVTASDDNGNKDTEQVAITVNKEVAVSVPATLTVTEGMDTNARITITPSSTFNNATTFNVSYSDGTATGAAIPSNGDYDNDAVTAVTFSATDTEKHIDIPITDDDLDEDGETFTVTIAASAALPGGIKLGKTTVTITDDDESPELGAIEDFTVRLGQAVDVTAEATDGDGDTVTYAWTRKDGETVPAIPGGTDLGRAQLMFTPAAAGTYTLTVTASDGNGNTDTEEVTVTVSSSAVVSVPSTLTVAEGVGNASVTVTTTAAFGKAVELSVAYGGSSATGAANPSDGDYDNDAVTVLTFGAGDTTKAIAIPITDDDLDEDDETFTVTIAATGGGLPGGWLLGTKKTTVTITDDDESPVLDEIEDVTVRLGQAVDITASATDGDGDTVAYAWTRKSGETVPAIPNGTALNQAQLMFTPAAVGTYTLTVTASDGNGNTDTEGVTVTVSSSAVVSVPAVLTVAEGVGNASVTVTTAAAFGTAVELSVAYGGSSATGAADPSDGDYDNDAVTVLTFGAGDTTKAIAIPITDDDLDESDETFTVTIAAGGGGLPDGWVLGTKKTTVTITDDDESPVLDEIEDVTVRLGQAVDITASATDGDGDTVAYAWTRKSGETVPAIPNGTALNQAQLMFTPAAVGTYTLTVTASDGNENEDTEEVTVTVSSSAVVSVPAVLTVAEGVGNASVTVTTAVAFGKAVELSVAYGGSSATGAADPSGGDYDNDAVTVLTFGAGDTAKAIAIPITDDDLDESDETFTVTIAAGDGGLPGGWVLGTKQTTVTITDDDESPVLDEIEDVTVRLGQAVDITASATDGDGDTVAYAWTRKSGETVPAIPNGTALNQAQLMFTPAAVGTYTLTVTASDGNENEDTEEVTVTVSSSAVVSVPAVLTVAEGVGNASVTVTTAAAFGTAVELSVAYGGSSATGAADPSGGDYDNDAVTVLTFGAGDTTKAIAIPITDDDLDESDETFTVTIAAGDGGLPGGWVLGTKQTTVTITDDDESPVLDEIEDVTVRLGQAVDITASATDGDGDTVAYAWTRKDGETVPAIPGGTDLGRARLMFTPAAVGTYTLTVTASDGNDNEDTEEVTVTVSSSAVVSVPAVLTVAEGVGNASVTVTTAAAFGTAVELSVAYGGSSATGAADPSDGDYDNDAVTVLTFGAGDTAKAIAIPITDDDLDESDETFTVTIAATGGGLPGGWLLGTKKTTVTITDDDESPVLDEIEDVTVRLGQAVDITASATDGDGDTVAYAWTRKSGETVPAIPNGTALNQAQLMFTPAAVGTYTLTVTASDGNENEDTEEVTVTVSSSAVVSVPAVLTVAEGVGNASVTVTTAVAFGKAVELSVAYGGSSATGAADPSDGDYDNDAVTVLTFGAGDRTKAIAIPITDDDLDESDETFTVTIAAGDGGLPGGWLLGTKQTTVTITDDDESPVLDEIEDVTVRLGQAVDITASATDGDGDTVAYAWTRKSGETVPAIPNGTALNQAQLMFTPAAVGTYTLTVTASDGNENEDTEEVTVTVSSSAVVSVPAVLTVAEGVGNASVTVTTAVAFGKAVELSVAYGGSSATGAADPSDGDYDNDAVTVLTFGAGDRTKAIAIPITDDDLDEDDETFMVTIATGDGGLPDGWVLGTKQTTVTITDDDESPVLDEIEDVTVRLGQAVDITASATDGDGDTVAYAWTRKSGETVPAIPNGTALNQAQLMFTPAAVGTYTLTVTASDGNENEDTEEVTVTVSSSAVVSVPAVLTVAEGVGNASVTVTTAVAFGKAVELSVAYGGSSATGAADPSDGDYDNDAVTVLTFGAGDRTKAIAIPITDDDLDESDETFTVTIAATGDGLPDGWVLGTKKTTVTITDDDESPELSSIADFTVRLGQAVDITASATDGDGDTVAYAWTRKSGETVPAIPNGTALNQAQLMFTPAAVGTYTLTVTASDGNENEDTEEVTVTVSSSAVVSVPAVLTVAEGVGNASVTVTTAVAFGTAVELSVAYGGSSATGAADPSDGDYDNDAVTVLTFGAGDTAKAIAIPITDDDLDESDETFTVTIAAGGGGLPDGWVLGTKKTTVTITDDDESPVLDEIEDVTVRLGQAVDITASATDGDGDTVAYAWTRKSGETVPAIPNGTALNQAQLMFTPAAVGTYTLTVTASDGNGNEDTEEVTVTVSSSAVVSVTAVLTVAEGVGNASVTVTTAVAFGKAVELSVAYGGSSATGAADPSDGDYDNDAVTVLTFGAGDTTKAIAIPITDDDLDESDETFTVTIAATGGGLPGGWVLGTKKTTVTITDDDESPELSSIADDTVKLGQAVDITAAATDGDGDTVTYAWTRKSGETVPAIPGGTDLNQARLMFTPAAVGTYTLTVTASDGNGNTDTEEVTVTVSSAAVVSVPAVLTVAEGVGNASVTVTTAVAFDTAVELSVAYGGSSATGAADPSDGDYDNDAVTVLTFGAGDTTKDIVIPITDDDLDEDAETFTVTIAAATEGSLPDGWALGNATTTVTITDDDAVGVTLSVTELTVAEGDENSYTVVLNSEPTTDVIITISGASGDVTLDKSSLTFTITNWSTAQIVTVSAAKDEDIAKDADVTLTHSASGGGYGSVTIDSVIVKVTEDDASNDEQVERVNRVHSELLPQLVEEMVSVDVVIRRIEDLEGGAPTGNSFRFGASPVTIQPLGLHDHQWLTESSQSRPTLHEMMNGAAFNVPIDDTGTSEGDLVFWGQSDWLSLSDSGNNVAWDGEMWSANFGADYRIRSDLLAGIAISRHQGQFDAETDNKKSIYETALNSVQPYMAWLLEDGSNLWTSAGYGDGGVRIKEEGSDSWQTVDLNISNVAVGGRGMLDLDPDMIEGGTTRLAIKGEGSYVRGETEASGILQALRVDTHRLRLLLQGSHERTLSDGEQLKSTLEMGIRYDGGETVEQSNLEVGVSVSYRNPLSRLTLEAHARGLIAAEKERKEWGVGGRVQLDSDAKGRGMYLKMVPTYGIVEGGFNQLFNHKSASTVSLEGKFNPRFHFEAELGYGVAVPNPGPLAIISPYAGLSLAEEGSRTFRLGTRCSQTENFSISIEAKRSFNTKEAAAEDGIALRGEIRW